MQQKKIVQWMSTAFWGISGRKKICSYSETDEDQAKDFKTVYVEVRILRTWKYNNNLLFYYSLWLLYDKKNYALLSLGGCYPLQPSALVKICLFTHNILHSILSLIQ